MTVEIEANGYAFTAELTGPSDGELVILLHGFPQSSHAWRAELKALAKAGYRACAPNQRGYSAGARPAAIDSYRVENLVSDVLAIADALGADDFHIVGHDWGGQIAWVTAALHSDRVRTLSVISRPHPRAFIKAMTEDSGQASRSRHHKSHLRPEMTEEMLADNAALYRRGLPAVDPRDIEIYLETVGSFDALDAALNWYRAVGKSKIRAADMPAVVIPTLYVWGNIDGTVGRTAAEGTADWVKAPYKFVEIPNVGHFVTDQVPGRFTPLLLEHLETYSNYAAEAGTSLSSANSHDGAAASSSREK